MFLQSTSAPIIDKLSGLDWSKFLDGIVAAIAILGSILSLTRSLSERSHSRSGLIARRNREIEEVGKLSGFCTHVAQVNLAPEHTQLLQQQIHSRLRESVAVIERVNLELAESAKDPNCQLSTWKRICLWFRPTGWREMALRLLTYLFFLAALSFGAITVIQYEPLRSTSHVMLKGLFRNIKQSGWPKIKLIFAAFVTVLVGAYSLLLALFLAGGQLLVGLLIAATGSLFVFVTFYAASRSARIRYALAEEKQPAAAASSFDPIARQHFTHTSAQ
jgi:hypothetical protein